MTASVVTQARIPVLCRVVEEAKLLEKGYLAQRAWDKNAQANCQHRGLPTASLCMAIIVVTAAVVVTAVVVWSHVRQ